MPRATFIRHLQSEQQKRVLANIEQLRIRKEQCKHSVGILNNLIMSFDIQIRDLRQSLPALAPVEVKPHRKSKEDKLQEQLTRLRQKNDKLEQELLELEMH